MNEDEVINDLIGTIRSYARGSKRALRYQLEDDYGALFPSKVGHALIPKSRAATEVIHNAGYKGRHTHHDLVNLGLVYEHMVPLSVLAGMLVEAINDQRKIKDLLQKYYQTCWVTKEEDKFLNGMGLRSSMPDGWAQNDPACARYQQAKIELVWPQRL